MPYIQESFSILILKGRKKNRHITRKKVVAKNFSCRFFLIVF
ncbi:hypothetical protein B4096_1810 [Heyndrickxia coagulans]|nr:hypothetical protein B4096_1810 [Heyndrickxia coagulans]